MKTLLGVSACILAGSGEVSATGIEQAYQSPRGAALGNAVIASVDDASALHYNVAGLAGVKDPQVQLNALGLFGSSEYSVAAGTGETKTDAAFTGSFFAAMPVADGLGVGLGVTTPHGLKVDWGKSHALRTLGYEGSLLHVRTSLGAGWEVVPGLEIGASVVYARDDIHLSQGLVVPGDRFKYEGDGGDWGWTVGARWEVFPGHRIAANYRSGIDVETDGNISVRSLTPPIPSGRSAASLVFPYPPQFLLGYAWRPDEKWLLEFNWQYTWWSELNALVLNQPAPLPDIVQPQGWSDTHFFSFGVSYQCTERTVLRAGYLHGTEAVPDRSYGPLIPDAPYHAISFGVGHKIKDWTVDAALIVSWREDRTVRGSSPSPISPVPINADGTWETDAIGIFLGATKHF